ncbi:MAG: pyridoxal-phosphate dependent enzyme [bacterium]|nr:pyridoxal-phosphate dependent enzyme [bacterium]
MELDVTQADSAATIVARINAEMDLRLRIRVGFKTNEISIESSVAFYDAVRRELHRHSASPETRIVGISVSENQKTMAGYVQTIARQTLDLLELDLDVTPKGIIAKDGYVGPGYGVLTPAVSETLSRFAKSEGILLDPVYTGKAMNGLIELLENGFFSPDETVVFLHTGGHPANFVYSSEILGQLG